MKSTLEELTLADIEMALEIGCVVFDNRPEVVSLNDYDFEYFKRTQSITPILGATDDRKTLSRSDIEVMEMQLRMNGCQGEIILVLPQGSNLIFGIPSIREVYSEALIAGKWRGHAVLIGAFSSYADRTHGMNAAVARNLLFPEGLHCHGAGLAVCPGHVSGTYRK